MSDDKIYPHRPEGDSFVEHPGKEFTSLDEAAFSRPFTPMEFQAKRIADALEDIVRFCHEIKKEHDEDFLPATEGKINDE